MVFRLQLCRAIRSLKRLTMLLDPTSKLVCRSFRTISREFDFLELRNDSVQRFERRGESIYIINKMERPDLNDSSPLQSYPRSPGEIPQYTPDILYIYFFPVFLQMIFNYEYS